MFTAIKDENLFWLFNRDIESRELKMAVARWPFFISGMLDSSKFPVGQVEFFSRESFCKAGRSFDKKLPSEQLLVLFLLLHPDNLPEKSSHQRRVPVPGLQKSLSEFLGIHLFL